MGAPKNNKFAEGNDGGRPTKLTSELLAKAREYLDTCRDEMTEQGKLSVQLPSIAGLARFLNVGRRSIYDWQTNDSEANKEFSHICEEVMAEQEKRLTGNGLAGTYNPTITKLLLTKHGYSDKQETEHTGAVNINLINSFDGDHNSA